MDSEHCTVKISPMTDRIGPRDAVTITVGTIWNKIVSVCVINNICTLKNH